MRRALPEAGVSARLDPVLALLLAAAAALLFWNLGNGCLWQDEAETGVLAKNILQFGYPKATDGVNRLNPSLPVAAGDAWTYHPWASMYLIAGSFRLLGADTTAARLPGALMGLLSIALAYRLLSRLSGERTLARWTAFLMTTSVPFLLMMRQCRYYAPSVLFSLWVIWAYVRFLQSRRWAMLELAAALTLMFHVNHGVFIPIVLGLALHGILTRPSCVLSKRGMAVLLPVLALTLPFAVYLQAGQHHTAFSWKEIRHHAEFYFRQTNHFLFPVTGWAIAWALLRPSWISMIGEKGSRLRETWVLAGCLIGPGLLFLVFGPTQRHFRYLVFLIPWFLGIQGILLDRLAKGRRPLTAILLFLLVFTDLGYSAPGLLASPPKPVRSLLWEFGGELTRLYRGPMDGVLDLLRARAKPGETIKIPYEDHTLLFYTDLAVEPIVHPEDFSRATFPDWIVIRRDWLPPGFFESSYFSDIQARYEKIVLDAPDIPWQNRPDPGYHRFRTDTQAPPVIVFKKKP